MRYVIGQNDYYWEYISLKVIAKQLKEQFDLPYYPEQKLHNPNLTYPDITRQSTYITYNLY